MNPKQSRFVAEYLKDSNATQAAIRAGYSANGASVQGTRLLANASIAAAIRERQQKLSAKLEETTVLSKAWVMERLHANYWAAFNGQPVVDRYGKPTGQNIQKIGDANKAAELIGKELGMFVEQRVNIPVETWADIVNGVYGSNAGAKSGDNSKLH